MSFILDALKKSEAERQRQQAPGLMDAGIAAPRAQLPLWALGLGILLIVNVVVLGVIVLRRAPAPPAATAAPLARLPRNTAPEAPAAEPSPPSPPHFSPLDNGPVYAPEIPVDAGAADATATRAQRPPPAAQAPARAQARVDAAEDNEVLPEISALNLSGNQALPDLHLDVHVYATDPAERFVYINMRKYREGNVLAEGPSVEHIRRDGVVLAYHGLRFLVPRQ